MSNIIVAKRSSFVALRPRVPSFAAILTNVGRLLRRKSRQEAQAEAIVNRFSCDRWSDAVEREISTRVR
jgi:hypothetical protein